MCVVPSRCFGRLADDAADGVAAAAGVEGGDRREVELADAARAGDGRGVDLVHRERPVQLGGGAVKALVLVLRALDRLKDPLGLDDPHHLLGRAGHEREGRVVELVLPGPIADQDSARHAPFDHRHADERADGRRPAVVGEQREARRLQHERTHLLQDGAQHAAAGGDAPLGDVRRVAGQLLHLEPLARLVEPQEGAGLQLQRRAQQRQVVVELLVDRLDRSLRQLLLLLGAAAHPVLGRQRRGDEAEVARLLAHRRHLALEAPPALAPLARHLGVEKHHVQEREDGDEDDVPWKGRRRLGRGAGTEREHRLEADRRRRQRQPDPQPVEGDEEADHRVDERIDRRGDAARERQQQVDGRQEQQPQLRVGDRLAAGGAAPLGGADARQRS